MTGQRRNIDYLQRAAVEHELIAQLAGDSETRREHEQLALQLHALDKQFVPEPGAVFDAHGTKIMGEAFDAACKELHDTGQPSLVYEVIAKRILDAAKNGERDLVRLRNAGLAALGFNKDGKQAP
jgi:hypothetical protein